MPGLTLDHAVPITQQAILAGLSVLLGLAIAALLITTFASRWRSLFASLLIFVVMGGAGVYGAQYTRHALNTRGIASTNAKLLTRAGEKTYGVHLTSAQVKILLTGTAAFTPRRGAVARFGTAELTVHDQPYPEYVAPVTLVWQRTAWRLLILDNGTYREVQHTA